MKRLLEFGLCAALLFAWLVSAGAASERRETPLVRAVQKARSAVVNIHSEKTAWDGDSLFAAGKGRKVNGMGTGIVVDERGYIVTNHHVVNGVETLRVTLDDGGTYTAQVVSYDRTQDLAIIRIDVTRPLAVMPLGTSSDLMLGETVVAVGNAFGYEHTVTCGIISALGRDVEVNEKQAYKNLIQTDASINPGNSGGPLLNLEGEVVGINVAIRAGAQRIGFAIPIDDARKVIARLLSIEQLNQTWHGVVTRDVKAGTTRKLLVASARSGSPALEAGFRPGDEIVRAGATDVVDGTDFERALLGRAAGETVEVVVRRNETSETLLLTLAAAKPRAPAVASPPETVVRTGHDSGDRPWGVLGLRLAALAKEDRGAMPSRYRGGLRVAEVRPGSPADSSGIRPGDILVGLHQWETVSPDNVTWVLDHPQFETFGPLKFYIVRNREALYGHLQVALAGE